MFDVFFFAAVKLKDLRYCMYIWKRYQKYSKMTTKIIEVKGDGNCLFRCFSYFLCKTESFHKGIWGNIIENVINNWDHYKNFIKGNNYYSTVKNKNDYFKKMSVLGIYGSDIEIMSFVEIYKVYVKIFTENYERNYIFGDHSYELKLSLIISGNYDNGHFNILEVFDGIEINNCLKETKNL